MWYNGLCNIPLIGCEATTKKLNKMKNYREFINWFCYLLEIATNRYKFKNIPDTMDERVILQSLLWYGAMTVFDKDGAVVALPSAPTNDFNLYGNPGYSWVWALNGYNEKIKLELPNGAAKITTTGVADNNLGDTGTGVFVRETKTLYPFINYVIEYAEQIADTMRTIECQRKHFKRPYIPVAKEEVVESVKSYFKKIDENEDTIVGTGVFDANAVNAIPITVSADEVKAMKDLVEWYISQFREKAGISNNVQNDKKERLLVDEINSNNEATEFSVNSVVDYINEQLDQVNSKFGLNIKAEVNDYGNEQPIQGSTDEQTE